MNNSSQVRKFGHDNGTDKSMKKAQTGTEDKSKKLRKQWKLLRSLLEYVLLRISIFIARLLPVNWVRKGAQWLFSKVQFRKSTAEENLKRVFPEMSSQERARILKEMYKNLALTAVESYLEKPESVFSKIETDGWEHVESVLASGKGVMIASGHLGNFEMAGRCMGKKAHVLVVVKRQHNPYFDKYANEQRIKDNCTPQRAGATLKPILRTLKNNGIVVIMTDQNARSNGVQLDFMGSPASTHISAARLAIKTGVPIVVAGVTRGENGYPLMHFNKPISVRDYEKNEQGYVKLMQRILDDLGVMIKRNPEHWFWVHRRWRRPEIAKKVEIDIEK